MFADLIQKSPYIIWMYWENVKGKQRPVYLDLCQKTIERNCSSKFKIIIVNEKTITRYVDLCVSAAELDKLCSIPQKTDYFRLLLLKTYGGIWLDSDIIVFQDMSLFIDRMLKDGFDYVGFGCYYEDCEKRIDGGPRPANWCMISPANGRLVNSALLHVETILTKTPFMLKLNYHCLGKDLLWQHIVKLAATKTWSYYHVSSRCLERDSQGRKLTNDRMISNEDIDTACKSKLIFIPVYNTAPGFPNSFLEMSEKELMASNMLISKYFRLALHRDS